MTAQLEVSILAAPVAAIDPRALSQAWYSALRFGPRTPPAFVTRNHADRAQTLAGRSTSSAAPQALRSRQCDRPRTAAQRPQRRAVSSGDSWNNALRYRAAVRFWQSGSSARSPVRTLTPNVRRSRWDAERRVSWSSFKRRESGPCCSRSAGPSCVAWSAELWRRHVAR